MKEEQPAVKEQALAQLHQLYISGMVTKEQVLMALGEDSVPQTVPPSPTHHVTLQQLLYYVGGFRHCRFCGRKLGSHDPSTHDDPYPRSCLRRLFIGFLFFCWG